MSDVPEPDALSGAPHPRHARVVVGHDRAEAAFLDAWNSGRLHHGWLLTGPRGVGKATLAWRMARFLLTDPPRPAETLDPPGGHPALARIEALAEPSLLLLRRPYDAKTKRLKTVITGEEARRLGPFLGLSAGAGDRRVVIIDAADEMNPTAANAILKLLEEPPRAVTLLLVSHQPARLLPTIRSRCRVLRLDPLSPPDLERAALAAGLEPPGAGLAELAGGSVGGAASLGQGGGAQIYADLVRLLGRLPMDRGAARKLADANAGRAAAETLPVTLAMLDKLMHRAARAGLVGPPPEAVPGEAEVLARLAPHDAAARRWAAVAQEVADRAAHGAAVNLDGASIVWDALARVEAAAREA
ncbi:DNA polymerase III subunit delta' [Jannaschia sp. Os4]|uniref:DNA polymerase III subunit delta' n=1 Tax=Jannaschia sp. Os4 TaxID=2807617 RepID=UPI00193AA634|nr:DNA polymerase III subunit delta' [Jannaschia sp. Os4]